MQRDPREGRFVWPAPSVSRLATHVEAFAQGHGVVAARGCSFGRPQAGEALFFEVFEFHRKSPFYQEGVGRRGVSSAAAKGVTASRNPRVVTLQS